MGGIVSLRASSNFWGCFPFGLALRFFLPEDRGWLHFRYIEGSRFGATFVFRDQERIAASRRSFRLAPKPDTFPIMGSRAFSVAFWLFHHDLLLFSGTCQPRSPLLSSLPSVVFLLASPHVRYAQWLQKPISTVIIWYEYGEDASRASIATSSANLDLSVAALSMFAIPALLLGGRSQCW